MRGVCETKMRNLLSETLIYRIRLCAFVRPRVPCVPCVSRLPPVSFYRIPLSLASHGMRLTKYIDLLLQPFGYQSTKVKGAGYRH